MQIPKEISRRIFIKGVNWVGDAVMMTPTLRALRNQFPEAHITLMVRPWVAPVFEHSPDINELWVEDESKSNGAFLKAARRIKAGEFTLGIAMPNSIRSALLLTLGKIKHRVGFARGPRRFLLTRPVELKSSYLDEHQVFYYLHMIEWMLDKKVKAPQLVVKAGESERNDVSQLLGRLGIAAGRPLIGIAPGSINSRAKRWLPERFAEVADRLHSSLNAHIFLLGTEQEADVLAEVESHLTAPVHNLAAEGLSLSQFIALAERLDGFIGNDAGAMHICAALNTPSVAVFGPTEWKTTSPFSPRARIVREQVDCSPCMLRDCPIDHRCMTRVTVDRVLEEFTKITSPA